MPGLTVSVRVDGVHETLAAFRQLPRDADTALRDASQRIAAALAGRVRAAAVTDSPQSALMATTVRPARDRVPVVVAGGAKRVGSRGTPAYKILFGSEFGSNTLRQFRPHLGSGSYWFFRTVQAAGAQMGTEWRRAADDIVRAFGGA